MNLMDAELLKSNCADDKGMMLELLTIGLESIDRAITGIHTNLEKQDWNELARAVHKLRPVLCYCGITSLSDDLLYIETNAKEQNNLAELVKLSAPVLDKIRVARTEVEQYLVKLSAN